MPPKFPLEMEGRIEEKICGAKWGRNQVLSFPQFAYSFPQFIE